MGVLLYIFCIFSEYLSLETFLDGCFCIFTLFHFCQLLCWESSYFQTRAVLIGQMNPRNSGHQILLFQIQQGAMASHLNSVINSYTAQKMKFFIEDFFSKCDQIRSFLRIWSHLLKKSLMENFSFLCSDATWFTRSIWWYFWRGDC